jgi:hypothetical protein
LHIFEQLERLIGAICAGMDQQQMRDHRSEAQTTHITCRFAMEALIDKENPQRCSICDPAHSNLMMKSQNMPVWLSEMVFRPFWPSIFAYEAGTRHTKGMHLPKKSVINWI